jgi:putative oxidoreductase
MQSAVAMFGRLLISPIFIFSAVQKFTGWSDTVVKLNTELEQALGRTLPEPTAAVLLGIAATVEIVGGLMVLFGCGARLGAFALFVFLIPTTVLFHDFWTFSEPERMNQMQHFAKNITIMGGLLMIMALGPGGASVDRRRQRPEARG